MNLHKTVSMVHFSAQFWLYQKSMHLNSSNYIIVGMSGGVDSSVAAFLLKQQGHRVEGVFMKNWETETGEEACSASADLADAEAVCNQLQIALHQVNFAEEYWERVFSHFLDEYKACRTPNPDILCNKEIKFKAFLNYAKRRGADYIATGHYARILKKNNEAHLLKGIDPTKDQSYFLHALDQTQLNMSLFPIGDFCKKTIRDMACRAGLKTHNKKDSTGICFIGERKFKSFLSDFLPAQPGNIATLDGTVIGRHDGLMFYTLGQRQGLNIGGQKNAIDAPWYVISKNIPQNTLIVAQGEHHPLLYSDTIYLKNVHWINGLPSSFPLTVQAKTRYRQSDQTCTIIPLDNDRYTIHFIEPQRAVTPGQSVVFYDNATCLGGGIIIHTESRGV